MKWNFIDTGFHDGRYNMDFDASLARRLGEEGGLPVLRLYGWKPYAISLGFNQKIEDIDSESCTANGFDVVRRPTGGRAILHAEELTYCVVMESGGMNISEAYHWIGKALVNGLRSFHSGIAMEQSQPDFPSLYRQPSSLSCFSSTARSEIQFGGRKLVGSAQRRYPSRREGNDIVLQHGSILIGPAHRRLAACVRQKGATEEAVMKSLEERTTELGSLLGRPVGFGEVAEAVKQGFQREWGITFVNLENGLAA